MASRIAFEDVQLIATHLTQCATNVLGVRISHSQISAVLTLTIRSR